MPRKFPKPFFRTGRGWFVQLGKQQIKLADGPENPNTEAAAWDEYHKVMVSRDCAPELAEADTALTVAEVFERFLAWCVNHREPRTYEWYRDHIQSFVNSLNGQAKQPFAVLKPFHVIEWTDGHKNWSAAYRRGAIVAVQRPFNWAERLGYIDRSPIRGVEKPQAQRREQFVTLKDWDRIRDCFEEGDPFRDFLEFCWETGCRPQEAKTITAGHVELKNRRVVFAPEEAKVKSRWRIIHLTEAAAAILRRRMKGGRQGVIFVNTKGRPWTASSTSCRFLRIKERLGAKFAAYDLRHGFATRLLANKADSLTVATLMGHADTRMLAKHYAHLEQRADHLRAELMRASGARN